MGGEGGRREGSGSRDAARGQLSPGAARPLLQESRPPARSASGARSPSTGSAPRPTLTPSDPSALPPRPPVPHDCAPSISKVRRVLSLSALPARSAPRRFLLRRPRAAVALLTSSSPSWARRTLTPLPMVAWSVPGAGSCCWRIREKRAAPGQTSTARGAQRSERGPLRAGGRDGRRLGPLPPPPPLPPGLLPSLLPRVRLLPPRLNDPDPAAAPARAASSLPKICNLRAGPAHAAYVTVTGAT